MEKLDEIIQAIEPLNKSVMEKVANHIDNLTKPVGSLGKIEQLAIQLSGITGEEKPNVSNPAVIVAAGDHGIVAEGVSAYPQEVTQLMLANFIKGKAAINVFANQIGASVYVVDVGVKGPVDIPTVKQCKVKNGTNNFLLEDAMTKEEALKAIQVGIDVAETLIKNGHKLLITGEMGIGNTTASSAIFAALTDERIEDVVGAGTGLTANALHHKVNVIKQSLENRKPASSDPLDVLNKVGGLEIAALTGVILAGAKSRVPVLIDGFISSAAALLAINFCPVIRDYLIISHQSAEQGHALLLKHVQLEPLLSLGLRLGEGTGAALAYPLLLAATNIVSEMATFEEMGIQK
ncbi:nicotinate-nucleotide--dimethylbenzimidazole phosphoribosyltransferase [Alkalihalobacterium bogoriense]|uniref:nicotinate-nucleotide--dimethylbenzimidazole phosphoribosyltransferase n=1 Tax=Alkalihalobacterium bogoriense TaxID=246272 RepID=UPI00047BCB6E|nr:nicotinate-nucleotide--dimethylbenzimidazole phosphoribosyltransferase [Alkalihalobacterium bogoriense]